MSVDRCICFDVPLSEIIARWDRGETLAQISTETGCCTGCGMCEPYARLALATKQSILPVLTPAQVKAIGVQAFGGKLSTEAGYRAARDAKRTKAPAAVLAPATVIPPAPDGMYP